MFLCKILVILFSLYNGVKTTNIVFHTNEIQCINMDHLYTKYYGKPCIIWKQAMKPYFDKVYCIFAKDSFGELISGCSPSFGNKDDRITVNYIITNNTYSDGKYTLRAEVGLKKDTIHPLYYLLMSLVFIFCFVFALNAPPQHWSRSVYYYRSHGGYRHGNRNTISWNRVQ